MTDQELIFSALRQVGLMVQSSRSARHGDRNQRRIAGIVRQTQSVSWQARRRGTGRACRSAAGRRQSTGEYQPDRRSRQELQGYHEGWADIQEYPVTVAHFGRFMSLVGSAPRRRESSVEEDSTQRVVD